VISATDGGIAALEAPVTHAVSGINKASKKESLGFTSDPDRGPI
jgi:hypothetical protein